MCLKGTNAQGRILKPKNSQRLILYLKDINLPKPDKYGTISLIAFLEAMISHKGFYDEHLEFIQLDKSIQMVATMNPPTTLGRHRISPRFTANVRMLHIDYPSMRSL